MMLRTFVFHSFLILVLMRSVNGNHRFWGDLIYYKSDHHYQLSNGRHGLDGVGRNEWRWRTPPTQPRSSQV